MNFAVTQERDDLVELMGHKRTNYLLWAVVLLGAGLSLLMGFKMLTSPSTYCEIRGFGLVNRPPLWVYTLTRTLGAALILDAVLLLSILRDSKVGFILHMVVCVVAIFASMLITKQAQPIITGVAHMVFISLLVSKDWVYFNAKSQLKTLRRAG